MNTMLSSAQFITPKPATPPPLSQPGQPTPAGPADGRSFAQFLNHQPDVIASPPHTEPVPADTDAAPEPAAERSAAPATAANAAIARRNQANAAPPPKPAAQAPNRTTDAAKAPEDGEATDAASTATDIAQDAQTAGLNEFTQLIGLATPAQTPQPATAGLSLPAATATAETGSEHAEPAAIQGMQAARTGLVADEERDPTVPNGRPETDALQASERRPADTATPRAADAPRAKGVELAAAAADKAAARSAASDLLQAASSAGPGNAPQSAKTPDALVTNFAAVLAQAMPAAAATAAPVSASGQVQAPVHSSAFAPELGARVSLLAVDGVQHAELQLNPADMGPVSVQIVVDGAQAHVSFHAAQAETRQALEQSLPDLAAALQGQGLTLSGGGVFQQASKDAQGGDDEAGGDDGRSSRIGASGDRLGGAGTAGAAVAARRSVGLLDTFA
jgi:flagellar hook-length control protein FliK